MSRIAQIFQNPLQLLYTLPAILIGLTVHEWAHAYAAYRLGDPTARNLGRMTLNPLAHIDIFGFIMLILVGFGWAKPVPVNPRNFKNLQAGRYHRFPRGHRDQRDSSRSCFRLFMSQACSNGDLAPTRRLLSIFGAIISSISRWQSST